MKNKISDLNNHLFEQLERLNDEDLIGEAFELEIKRSKEMANIAKNIIENNKVAVEVLKMAEKAGVDITRTVAGKTLLINKSEEL